MRVAIFRASSQLERESFQHFADLVLRLTILRRSIEVDSPPNPPEHRTSHRPPGKVIQLNGGNTFNIYAEAQPSLYRSGAGAPNYQFFTGIALQSPPPFTNSWHLS